MKATIAFCLLVLFALPSFAQSAVDNCCQVNRSCATDGEWTQGWFDYQAGLCPAAAPAGTSAPAPAPAADVDNCCQVNRSCTTDPEWIQGWNDYQAGLCPVSAPAGASQPAAPAPAPAAAVDNCCQVNRSCSADADWIQGWNDFQAGLCPVSTPAVSTPADTAAPPPPAADVNNCCQIGRACHTDADWIRGYNDYQAGQCGGGVGPAPTGGASSANHHSFTGTGRSATRAFTLTRGKWRFNPNLGRSADTFLVQVSSPGQALHSGTCLTFPSNLHWRGESGAGLRLGAYVHEFAVRYTCDAQFVVFPELSSSDVQGQPWTININKTDGNI